MSKKPFTAGVATKSFNIHPVLILIDHFFTREDTYPMLKNGLKVEMYEVDGMYLVVLDKDTPISKKAYLFLEKEEALDFIEFHGVQIRDDEDDE